MRKRIDRALGSCRYSDSEYIISQVIIGDWKDFVESELLVMEYMEILN